MYFTLRSYLHLDLVASHVLGGICGERLLDSEGLELGTVVRSPLSWAGVF